MEDKTGGERRKKGKHKLKQITWGGERGKLVKKKGQGIGEISSTGEGSQESPAGVYMLLV